MPAHAFFIGLFVYTAIILLPGYWRQLRAANKTIDEQQEYIARLEFEKKDLVLANLKAIQHGAWQHGEIQAEIRPYQDRSNQVFTDPSQDFSGIQVLDYRQGGVLAHYVIEPEDIFYWDNDKKRRLHYESGAWQRMFSRITQLYYSAIRPHRA